MPISIASSTAHLERRAAPSQRVAAAARKGLIDVLVTGAKHYSAAQRLEDIPPDVSDADRLAATRRFFSAVGLGDGVELDKALVGEVLDRYFALSGETGTPRSRQRALTIRGHIEAALAAKGSLRDMLTRLEGDVATKQAPISQFLALADLSSIEQSPKVRETARRVAHHAYVLDALVALMIEDPELSKEVRRHFYHQREARGITLGRIAELAGTFGAVKTATIDMVFRPVLGLVVGLERTRESKQLLTLDKMAWANSGVPLNITEAMVTEAMKGAYDNALAALRLATRPASAGSLGGKDKELLLQYPAGWTALYESWNLLFVLSNLEDPDLLIAKLLIPSLVSAEPESYIYRRTLALWITIQSYLFLKDEGVKSADLGLDPAELAALAKLWGQINRKASDALARTPGVARRPWQVLAAQGH